MLGKLIPSFYTFLMNKKIYNTFLNILIKRKYFFIIIFKIMKNIIFLVSSEENLNIYIFK